MSNAKREIISPGFQRQRLVLHCFENKGSFMEGRIFSREQCNDRYEQSNTDSIYVHGQCYMLRIVMGAQLH